MTKKKRREYKKKQTQSKRKKKNGNLTTPNVTDKNHHNLYINHMANVSRHKTWILVLLKFNQMKNISN